MHEKGQRGEKNGQTENNSPGLEAKVEKEWGKPGIFHKHLKNKYRCHKGKI